MKVKQYRKKQENSRLSMTTHLELYDAKIGPAEIDPSTKPR